MARSALATGTQVGKETNYGEAVAAGKKLASLGFTFSPSIASNMYRPDGTKYATVSAPGEERTNLSVSGSPTYDEIIYALSSVGTQAVITSPDAAGAPSAREWSILPNSSNEDDPASYTVEQGSDVRAHRAAGVQISEMSLSGNTGRQSLELSGSAIARQLEDGIAMTAGPTALPIVPIRPTQVSWFLDPTFAAMGTTKLGQVMAWTWSVANRFGPASYYDAAEPSYAELVETEPDATVELTPAAEAQGMGLLPVMRSGDTRFLRIEAVGPLIGGTASYRLRLDQAVKVREPGEFSDTDGVFTLPFTFQIIHDATMGRAWSANVINTQAAL